MNKIAIFSDIHLGVHQNNDFWLGIANKWADWYIKELKDKNITDIIFCGDFFHYRDEISVKTLNFAKDLLDMFKDFKIDEKLMSFSKKQGTIFLHCLPRGDEVSDNVFLGKKSHVWQQALNRVHVQKSILLYCFGKLR